LRHNFSAVAVERGSYQRSWQTCTAPQWQHQRTIPRGAHGSPQSCASAASRTARRCWHGSARGIALALRSKRSDRRVRLLPFSSAPSCRRSLTWLAQLERRLEAQEHIFEALASTAGRACM
jgi:hypothetical protein